MSFKHLCLVLFFLVSACEVESKGDQLMSKTIVDYQIYCLGRTHISIPSSFVIAPLVTGRFKEEGTDVKAGEIEIMVSQIASSTSGFSEKIRRRRDELDLRQLGLQRNMIMQKQLAKNMILFRVHDIAEAYTSELILLRGDSLVSMTLESYHSQYEAAENRLITLAERLEFNDAEQSAGYCLGRVKLKGNFVFETAGFLFKNTQGEEFDIRLDTFARDDKITLLERMTGDDSLLKKVDVEHAVLRSRERIAGGMRAQEWLGSFAIDEDGDSSFNFTLETMRSNPGRRAPHIHLSFDTAQPTKDGRKHKSVRTSDEAMQIWDSVVDSIRPAGT